MSAAVAVAVVVCLGVQAIPAYSQAHEDMSFHQGAQSLLNKDPLAGSMYAQLPADITVLSPDISPQLASSAKLVSDLEPKSYVYGPSLKDAGFHSSGLEAASGATRAPGIPLELEQIVALTFHNYPSIKAAKAQLRAARYDIKAAKQQQLPSLTVEGVGFTGGSEYAASNNMALNLAVDQPLWTGGRISSNIRKAKALHEVALQKVFEERRALQLKATEAYYQLALSVESEAILQAGLQAHEALVDSISRRVDAAISPLSDLTLARSRTAQLRQQLAQNAAEHFNALQTLQQLIGQRDFDFGYAPEYDSLAHNPAPEGLAERAVACDPALVRLAREEDVARAEADIAKAQIFPQVGAQFSSNEVTGERVGLVLRAQTSGGLSQVSNYQAAQVRITAYADQKATQIREIRQRMQSDLLINISTRDQIASGVDASSNTKAVTESYRRQFVAGKRTWLDVMNSVREATNAELTVAQAKNQAMLTNARLLLRACIWQPDYQDTEVGS